MQAMTRTNLAAFLSLSLFPATYAACGPTHTATSIIVDCTVDNAPTIAKLVDEFKTLLRGQQPDWDRVTALAVEAGQRIGGCAFAKAVQWYTSTPSLAANYTTARAAFEAYRAEHAAGVTFRTASGDL